MAELIDALAGDLVASGLGTRYSANATGVSIQVNHRREMGAQTVVLLRQTGGTAFPQDPKEQQGIQVLVDSSNLLSGQETARSVFDQFHERTAETISGFDVLWLRSTSGPPQMLGTAAGLPERFLFSVNFDALIRKAS